MEKKSEANKIRFTRYKPHTAYGFKGGKVLARRSGSSAGGDEELEESIITEARHAGTSIDDELLGHLTHTRDLPHEDPRHAQAAIDLLQQFHNLRSGLPSTITASYKHDGGSSIHIINQNGRIGISDKHRYARGVVAWSPEDIDKHFGHIPEYASALKHIWANGQNIVGRNRHVQGDILWTPNDTHRQMGGMTTYTANRITGKVRSKAPVGLAIHTEITNGVAHVPTKGAVHNHSSVFIPQNSFKPDPHNYDLESRNAVQHHLQAAKELLANYDPSHLTPEHIKHLTSYMNRTLRQGTEPNLKGYLKHLQQTSQVEVGKRKSPVGQKRIGDFYSGMMQHVKDNSDAFQQTLQLRHHLNQATESLLKGLRHPDVETSIDGVASPGEGVVLAMKDKQGRSRPVSKLVSRPVSQKILNNPRFAK